MELRARTNVHVYPSGGVICSVQTNMMGGGGSEHNGVFYDHHNRRYQVSSQKTFLVRLHTSWGGRAVKQIHQYVINDQHLSVWLCSSNLNMPLNNIFASIKTACMQTCVIKLLWQGRHINPSTAWLKDLRDLTCWVHLEKSTVCWGIDCSGFFTQQSSPVTVNYKIQYKGRRWKEEEKYSKWDSMILNAEKKKKKKKS